MVKKRIIKESTTLPTYYTGQSQKELMQFIKDSIDLAIARTDMDPSMPMWIDVDSEIENEYGHQSSVTTVTLSGSRYESDKEQKARLSKARKAREKKKAEEAARKVEQEKQERREYERLQKKFGDA